MFLLLICFIFVAFFLRSMVWKQGNVSVLNGSEQLFSILITEPISVNGDKWTAVGKDVKTEEKLFLSYRIKEEEEKKYFESTSLLGNICVVNGELTAPSIATNEHAFDYQRYLNRKSIFWILELDRQSFGICTNQQEKQIIYQLKKIRENGIRWLQDHFSPASMPLASALIFGDRSFLDESVQSAYQRLGIIHLLAISGSHVVILIGIFYYLLMRIGLTKEKISLLLFILLPAYAVLTGLSPSVNRAVLTAMLVLLKVNSSFLTKLIGIDLLSIVLIIYLFFEPSILFDVGFLLSFTVCFFLLLSSSMIASFQNAPIKGYLFTTFLCEIAVLPIILSFFYELPVLSLMANLFYIPFFSVIVMPSLFFLFILSFFLADWMLKVLLFPMDFMLSFSDYLVVAVSKFSWSTFIVGKPNIGFVCLYVIGIPSFFYLYERLQASFKKYLLVLPILLIGFQCLTTRYSSAGEITVLDVGQGDSIFIQQPFNQGTYLIDTGGVISIDKEEWQVRKDPFEVGKDIVVPFLKSKGVTVLDKLILTHGDIDHIGGSLAILQSIKVKEIVLSAQTIGELTTTEEEIIKMAELKSIPIKMVKLGDKWQSGNIVFHVLSPIDADSDKKNNQSIVLFVKVNGISWLFTGDLEKEGEEKLIERYPMLQADILKVGHHGSKTSTSKEFIAHINPNIAVISVGRNNRYGHPSKEVIERLEEQKILIWRTDVHGAITFYFSKKGSTFQLQIP